ncbi:uncharacterized protein KQ657_004482 [Scheffersomyces spartinae]|uniref:Ran-specific GTPase-activating protein 30 n=1 Tax=Scheffersomyces spartinae TaxID=45513 RepID=A0A9P7VB38_9ASCO|nr:uncharacterized protein KQ657_004482 [Scheffersomyces spartinae]KAG7194801.1 hypothetical protein KQ657_004482 [Scheffersomyces spartinae]
MDAIISKASNQAVTFAIRSGISLASGYAVKTVSKYLETQRKVAIDAAASKRLQKLQTLLESRVRVLTETFSLVRLLATVGRAETWDAVVALVDQLETELATFTISVDETPEIVERKIQSLTAEINGLLPVLTLALTTANVTHMYYYTPEKVSLTSLLRLYDRMKQNETSFDLKLYSIFYNPGRITDGGDPTLAISWKETFARCKVKIIEESPFRYSLSVEELFDDERYHDDDEKPLKMRYNVDVINKMFFTRLGNLLRLDNGDYPVLILKLVDDGKEEWLAFGSYEETKSDDEESDSDEEEDDGTKNNNVKGKERDFSKTYANSELNLLDTIIRLYKYEQAERKHVLNATDSKLAIYLNKDQSQQIDYNTHLSSSNAILNSNISRLDTLKLE